MVFESPPDALGTFDDFWFRWVIDFGLPGPDRGQGGKYLLLPPDYNGPLPQGGYNVARSRNSPPPPTVFHEGSGVVVNTIPPNDFSFYELLNEVVQQEPATSLDPELMGPLAAIGIIKGKPFAPDARMKKILTDAVALANATSRTLTMKPRDPNWYYYPD